MNDALDSLSQVRNVEIHEQADGATGQLEIGDQLGLMDWSESFDCLQFHDEDAVDD